MSENNVNGITGASVTTTGIIGGTVGIGQYIVNDYVITIAEAEGDYGYTMTITKGTQTQTVTLYGLTPAQYDAMLGYLEQAQAAAQSAQSAAESAGESETAAREFERVAGISASSASSAKTAAQSAASNARSAASDAASAKNDAVTAKNAAEAAATRAETSAGQITGMTAEAETLEPGSSATASFLDGVLSLGIPAGANGANGNGIVSITKTGTEGNKDTYTITYTNGTTSNFTVTNGVDGAVTSVAGKTGAVILDAGDVSYDDQQTYDDGTVGAGITNLKSQIGELASVSTVITPTWTTSKRIIEDGSEVNSGVAFGVTDYIAVIDVEEMVVAGVNANSAVEMPSIHYYNAAKEHVGYTYVYDTYSIKKDVAEYDAAYIRLSSYDNGTHPFSAVTVSFYIPGEVENNRRDINKLLDTAVIAVDRTPKNLLNEVELYPNLRWMANSAQYTAADGFTLSDFIEINPEKYYAFVTRTQLITQPGDIGLGVYYAQFDDNQQIIIQSNNGYANKIKPGATTKYLRISFPTSRLEENPIFAEAPFTGDIANPKKEISDVYKTISADEISFKGKNQQYKNLLAGHRDSLADGKFLANGIIVNNANWIVLSDYIPCLPSTSYNGAVLTQLTYNPSFKVSWYAENGDYISEDMHANNTPFVSPENAAFFRITTVKGNVSTFDDIFFSATDLPYGPPCIDTSPVFMGIYPTTTLSGKTWAAFGDSITEKNVRTTINYHDYIRAETGITVINKGVGGSGYKCRWQNDNNIPALADAFDFTGVDIVTCMAGINDAWTDLTDNMGNADDVYDTSSTAQNQSVMACFNHFLDIVIAKAPLAKIGIISPIPCYHTQSGTLYDFNPANDNSTLAQFVEKCKVSCKHHGIPYLDLFHNSGLRPWDSTVNEAMFKCNASDSPDGLHPNYLGHKYFYPLVREFVKQLS